MMKQKILAVLTSLCIGVLPLAAGMAAAPVAAEDSTEPVRILAMTPLQTAISTGTTAIGNTFATKCSKKDLPISIW